MAENIKTLNARAARLQARLERIEQCQARTKKNAEKAAFADEIERRQAELHYIATKIKALQNG